MSQKDDQGTNLCRIVVVGPSGAGKSTLTRELARRKNVSLIELDALYWKADWTAAPADEMRLAVAQTVASPFWILDGNYLKMRDITWARADTIIWLDYAFPVVFSRAVQRTLRRVIRREELWNGNRENWKTLFSRDSILLWVIKIYRKSRQSIAEALMQPEFAHLHVVHLRSPRQAQEWLAQIADTPRNETTMGLKDELKEYYTVEELAAVLRVTNAAIEKLTHGGEIAHDIADAAIRIPRREVEKLLNQRRRAKMRRAGLAGLGLFAAVAGVIAAFKLRKREDESTSDE